MSMINQMKPKRRSEVTKPAGPDVNCDMAYSSFQQITAASAALDSFEELSMVDK
jgi:hypothetical protein